MAWYNIIDNTCGALELRKEVNEIESTAKTLLKSIESTKETSSEKVLNSETEYTVSLDRFKEASALAWSIVAKFTDIEINTQDFKESNQKTDFIHPDVTLEKLDGRHLESLLKAGASGGVAAFGAYTAVGAFATASTGTAISATTGIAASNAIMAWFGGGAIAAGGGGMAAGTIVLSGIFVAPVLFVVADHASDYYDKKKNSAKKYLKEMEVSYKQANKQAQHIRNVSNRIDEKVKFLNYLSERLELYILTLKELLTDCLSLIHI